MTNEKQDLTFLFELTFTPKQVEFLQEFGDGYKHACNLDFLKKLADGKTMIKEDPNFQCGLGATLQRVISMGMVAWHAVNKKDSTKEDYLFPGFEPKDLYHDQYSVFEPLEVKSIELDWFYETYETPNTMTEEQAIEEVSKALTEIHEADQALLNSLGIPSIHKDLEDFAKEVGFDYWDWQKIELVPSPEGELEEVSFGAIQEVYWDQHEVGYHGDSSKGDVYAKIGETKFLKLGYSF